MFLNNFYEGTPVNIINIDNVKSILTIFLETKKNRWTKGWEIWDKESFALRNEKNLGPRTVMFRTKTNE